MLAFLFAVVQEIEGMYPPYVEEFNYKSVGQANRFWRRASGEGFPEFNEFLIQRDDSTKGPRSSFLRMNSFGENTGYETVAGLLGGNWGENPDPPDPVKFPVSSGYSYELTACVRLSGTRQNGASIGLRWLDRKGFPLAEEMTSQRRQAPDWTPIIYRAKDPPAGAAYAQILLRFGGPDFRGRCDWDGIELRAAPRVVVERVGFSYPIIQRGMSVKYRVGIPRLKSGQVDLKVSVEDVYGSPVGDAVTYTLRAMEFLKYEFTPVSPGFYEVQFSVAGKEGVLARASESLAVTSTLPLGVGGGAFGVIVNPYSTLYPVFSEFLKLLSPGHLKVVVWDRSSVRMENPPGFQDVYEIARQGYEESLQLTGTFGSPPPHLFARGDLGQLVGGSPALFLKPHEFWEEVLKGFLETENFTEMIKSWQITKDEDLEQLGGLDVTQAFGIWRKAIEKEQRFAQFGTPVKVADLSRLPDGVDFISITWKPGDPLPDLSMWGRKLHVLLRVQESEGTSDAAMRVADVRDFVQGVAEARYAFGPEIPIFMPLTSSVRGSLLDAQGNPSALFVAYRVVNYLLGSARAAPDLHFLDPPAHALAFEFAGKALGVVWADKPLSLETFFGPNVFVVDPFGNQKAFEMRKRLEIGPMPVFIVGADASLLRTQASLRFEPDALPMKESMTVSTLRFKNRFGVPLRNIEVTVRPSDPKWKLEPTFFTRAKLEPGQEFEEKIRFSLPQTVLLGEGGVQVNLEFNRDGPEGVEIFRVPVAKAFTLAPLIRPTVTLRWSTLHPGAVEATVRIQNVSDRRRDIESGLYVPGQPPERRPFTLDPTQVVEYRDVLLDAKRYVGQKVRVTVWERGGDLAFAQTQAEVEPP